MSEVVIVGGGIAGSSLAVLLARGGVDVTVLERKSALVLFSTTSSEASVDV